MQVIIKNVDVQWNGTGAKRWAKASVEYTYNGEARKQNVMSFSNPDVFKKVQELTGQTVEVELTKNDKGYSEWKSVSVGQNQQPNSSANGSSPTTTRVTGSNYETKEERAARQVLIVKQSSLSNAISLLTTGAKTPPAKDDVLNLAQDFTDWVLDKPEDKTGFDNMSDDIPF
jgi:hypothetical protein